MLHFGNFRLRWQQNCSLIYYRSPALKEPNSSDGSEDDPKYEPNAALHVLSLPPPHRRLSTIQRLLVGDIREFPPEAG